LRKRIKDNRTKGIDVWHERNKEIFLRGGQFVDAIKRSESEINKRMEARLEEIEKHEAIVEAQRISDLQKEREGQLLVYEVENVDKLALGTMDELVWNNFLSGTKSSFEARKEAERKAHEEAMELERIEGVHRQRSFETARYSKFMSGAFDLRNSSELDYQNYLSSLKSLESEHEAEQEKLRLEAEELRKKNEAVEAMIKAQKDKADEEARKAKELADAEALRLKEESDKLIEAEKQKAAAAQAELKRRQDEEAQAEANRKAEEQRLTKEQAKLAKAPVKKQLNVWIDSITTEIPATLSEDETAKLIIQKFEAFKTWAKSQVDSI